MLLLKYFLFYLITDLTQKLEFMKNIVKISILEKTNELIDSITCGIASLTESE